MPDVNFIPYTLILLLIYIIRFIQKSHVYDRHNIYLVVYYSIIYGYLVCTILISMSVNCAPMTDHQLEKTLADRVIMQRHIKCALGEGPCDPVGIRLRTLAPLVLRGACPQCSPQETRQIRRTLAFVQRNYPWEWAKIVRQYG